MEKPESQPKNAATSPIAACHAALELLMEDENGESILRDPTDIEAETEVDAVRGMLRSAIAGHLAEAEEPER